METLIHPELNHEFNVVVSGDGNNTIIITEINSELEFIKCLKKILIEIFIFYLQSFIL